MKRLLFCVAVVAVFASCGKSPEKKAQALIEEAVKNALYIPDSYDPIETQLDSAFSPLDDAVFYEKVLKLYGDIIEMQSYEEKAKMAKSKMSIWSNPYDSFSRNEYNEAKEEYEDYTQKMNDLQEQMQELGAEIGSIFSQEPEFIGYKAIHRYRANNNAGDVLMGGRYFLFDREVSEIVASYDEDDYDTVQQGLQMFQAALENAINTQQPQQQ